MYTWDGENRLIRSSLSGVPARGQEVGDRVGLHEPPCGKEGLYIRQWMGNSRAGSPLCLRPLERRSCSQRARQQFHSQRMHLGTGPLGTIGFSASLLASGWCSRRCGIGGLLGIEETSGTHAGSYWLFYAANGNVSEVIKNTTTPSNYPIAAHYEYDPYGNPVVEADADSSGYVQENHSGSVPNGSTPRQDVTTTASVITVPAWVDG